MNIFKSKFSIRILVGIAASLLAAALIFIAINGGYFFKQLKFLFYKPQITQNQNSNTDSEEEKGQPNQISIPSLGISAPIVESKESNEQSFQEALKSGVVHYPGTAEAGQPGNPYLFAHSSDFAFKGGDYKTVFALLPSISKGADIVVSNEDGQIFHYEVIESFVANKDDVHLLDQNTNGEKRLTLQTSYPIGTALKRWIVIAKLKE